jgi:transcriptional regulator with XRE-family HTH domain
MATVKELLAVNLKFYRALLGLSPQRVAELAGLSPAYIKDIEKAKKFPKAAVLERLSAILNRKPCELLYEGDEWENRDSIDNLAGLYFELKEKINDTLEETVRRCLGL